MNKKLVFTISMILSVPLALVFVISVEPELPPEQCIAMAVILGGIASFVLTVIISSNDSEDGSTLEATHTDEAERAFALLDRELLDIYSSLSRQYEKISDFLYLYPQYAARLKETERYKDWRDRLLYWADENIERLNEFYFHDGDVCYINKDLELVNLYEETNGMFNSDASVICEVSIKRGRIPEDYFENPFTVWEEEDMSDIDISRCSDYKDEATSSFALGVGLGLSGHDSDHGCDSDDCCSDCDCGCQ